MFLCGARKRPKEFETKMRLSPFPFPPPELNRPAHRCLCLRFACRLTAAGARLEVRMESLLLSRRALSSPTICRFIPAHSVTSSPASDLAESSVGPLDFEGDSHYCAEKTVRSRRRTRKLVCHLVAVTFSPSRQDILPFELVREMQHPCRTDRVRWARARN